MFWRRVVRIFGFVAKPESTFRSIQGSFILSLMFYSLFGLVRPFLEFSKFQSPSPLNSFVARVVAWFLCQGSPYLVPTCRPKSICCFFILGDCACDSFFLADHVVDASSFACLRWIMGQFFVSTFIFVLTIEWYDVHSHMTEPWSLKAAHWSHHFLACSYTWHC